MKDIGFLLNRELVDELFSVIDEQMACARIV